MDPIDTTEHQMDT